jgi:hypothetical protein
MKKPAKKQKILFMSLIAAVAVLVISIPTIIYFAEKNASEKTYSLGSQLEYVGKESYGCWLICDSNPSSIYYYATDMNVDQVIQYFRNTSIEQQPRTLDGETDFILTTKSGEDISIYYYSDKAKITKDMALKASNRSHIISIPSFHYSIAQKTIQ